MAKNTKSENPPKAGISKGDAAQEKKDNNNVFYLELCIIIFGLLAVILVGGAAIIAAFYEPQGQRVSSVKDILSILLPVISAWIGTVIAYYFTKENFKSATDSTTKLFRQFTTVEEKLRSITAREVMIDIDKATKLVMKKDRKESDIKLIKDIIEGKLDKDKDSKRNRLPILDYKMCPKYIVHRSTINEFIVKATVLAAPAAPAAPSAAAPAAPPPAAAPPAAPKPEDLTLQDMIDDPLFTNTVVNSFRTVKETSNLAEVKAFIDDVKECSDVFVTEDGGQNTKVLGWITNVIVAEKSVV
jgi:hypothetical protein